MEALRRLASRTGMRELTVRSLLHGARLLAAEIDNPALRTNEVLAQA